ncbi:MAG: hypothetical protein JKY13_02465 [Gammaproteobacteria bacterium]|nr:hypothetical protein [Gammaproteobacteria bacterium]
MPKPVAITHVIEGDDKQCALQAWSNVVERVISEVGSLFRSVACDGAPTIHITIANRGR